MAPSVIPAPIRATVAPPPSSASVETAAERRYLTVMFCDLVGSTSIAAILDAEEWRDLVGGYLVAASASVTEMGGHVAKKLGDGLLALFGYPVAQENDDMLRHACGFKLANDNRRAEIAGEMLPGANRIRSRLSATNICLSIGAMQAACERAKKCRRHF